MYYLMSLILFILGNMFFILSMYMYMYMIIYYIEWVIYYYMSFDMTYIIYLDYMFFMFISVVMIISSMVILYSIEYMHGDYNINRFMYLIILFILSMFFMVISPSLMSILLGWDGLGLISYCLVIYYQNYSSYSSGMLTILCNRVGDVGLLMLIGLMYMLGEWNLFMYMNYNQSLMLVLMLIMVAITKSAQLPFSSWLPAAMAAPTPISALVHSSTLVTAGVYLMIRYSFLLMESGMNMVLLILSSLTLLIAGVMANFEYDLKKIIALSTLSQLGIMMIILSLGFYKFSLYHLLTHALFKSLLFLCAGALIHYIGSQDIRFFGGLVYLLPYLSTMFFISTLSLCGFPFLAGFYSKDLIMEVMMMSSLNYFLMLMNMFSVILTVSYSVRLLYYLFLGSMNFYLFNMIDENKLMNLSMIILFMNSIYLGSLLMWVFYMNYLILLSSIMKLMIMIFCCVGVFLGMLIYKINFMKYNLLLMFICSLWFMNKFYSYIYLMFLNLGEYYYIFMEKGVLEYIIYSLNIKKYYSVFNYSLTISIMLKYFIFMMFMYMLLI